MANNNNSMVQHESFLGVAPHKPTSPRPSYRISSEKLREPGFLKQCVHMFLCYEKASDEDSGWIAAGWAKTSMGIALSEKPMLAGRLRRAEDGGLEIVLNDSGIRIVEAQSPMSLDEFVGLKNKDDLRNQLVYWKSIDDEDTRFSPLMYMQVTNFKCGAYAIGISCSILVADPFSLSSFLKRWAEIHMNLVTESHPQKLPLFYLPHFRKPNSTPIFSPNYEPPKETSRHTSTLIFKFANLTMDSDMQREVALSCIEKVDSRLGNKSPRNFSLVVKDKEPSNDIFKIDTISVEQIISLDSFKNTTGIDSADSDLGDYIDVEAISIAEGNKPVDCMCWISSPVEEGLVMIISSDSDLTVIVTVPSMIL